MSPSLSPPGKPRTGKQLALERNLLQRLQHAFEAAGWEVQSEPGPVDLLVRPPSGGPAFVLEMKTSRDGRRDLLPALLARAALEAQHHAREWPGLRPLAIVGAPHITATLAADIAAFAERYLDGVAFGWVDAQGQVRLRGAGLDSIRDDAAPGPGPRVAMKPARAFPLFSDLNQWMLKVLLAERVSPELLNSPSERPLNARHLAHVANTSVPSASRLVAYLREQGFVEAWKGGLELVQVPYLLERWRRSAAGPVVEERMRWMLPGRAASIERLSLALQDYQSPRLRSVHLSDVRPRACLGLFAACDRLGFSHVRGVPPHLYLEDLDEAVLVRLGLRRAAPSEPADVLVRRPQASEALFRACVEREGVLVADAVQCWLDVAEHPSRGDEQASVLANRALKRLFSDDGEAL